MIRKTIRRAADKALAFLEYGWIVLIATAEVLRGESEANERSTQSIATPDPTPDVESSDVDLLADVVYLKGRGVKNPEKVARDWAAAKKQVATNSKGNS